MDINRVSKIQLELLRKAVRDYYSGVDLKIIKKRYGLTSKHIISLSDKYQGDKFDIFERGRPKPITKSMALKNEKNRFIEVQEARIRALEAQVKEMSHTVKMANIKEEGYEFMLSLLKTDYGIDLAKKLEAKQSSSSKSSTKK